jgi:hypothetical protein
LVLVAAASTLALVSFAVPAAASGERLVSSIPTIKIVWNPVRDDRSLDPTTSRVTT